MFKKIKLSQFIGRQLSRLKMGQVYYVMGMYSITAVGILKVAFPQISIWTFILFIPFMFVGAFLIGFIADRSNVTTMDYQKTIEMTNRYLTILDFKNNDFRILQMETMFEWIKSLKENKPLDKNILNEKYKEFLNKWSPKKENEK